MYATSSASVEIHNNVNSSSTSNSNVSSKTNITVETNGQVTHYESDKPGSVSVKSVNGESEIKVDGQTVTNTPQNTSATPTKDISQTPSPTPKLNEEQKKQLNQIEIVFDEIKEKISSLQEKLSSLFGQN